MAKTKNSLVDNINRRKKLGISRPKSGSHVSKAAWDQMKAGWPKSKKAKQANAATPKAATKRKTKAKSGSTSKAKSGSKSKAKTRG